MSEDWYMGLMFGRLVMEKNSIDVCVVIGVYLCFDLLILVFVFFVI